MAPKKEVAADTKRGAVTSVGHDEYCSKCGCDVFECGGNVTGECIRKRGADPRALCGVFRQFLNDPTLTLEWLERALAAQGLHVVTAADKAEMLRRAEHAEEMFARLNAHTQAIVDAANSRIAHAERALLDACAALPDVDVSTTAHDAPDEYWRAFGAAELARREAAK